MQIPIGKVFKRKTCFAILIIKGIVFNFLTEQFYQHSHVTCFEFEQPTETQWDHYLKNRLEECYLIPWASTRSRRAKYTTIVSCIEALKI